MFKRFVFYYKNEVNHAFLHLSTKKLWLILMGLSIMFSLLIPFYYRKLELISGGLSILLWIFSLFVVMLLLFVELNIIIALFCRYKHNK